MSKMFRGYLGFEGKMKVSGTEENLLYFVKDLYGVSDCEFEKTEGYVTTIVTKEDPREAVRIKGDFYAELNTELSVDDYSSDEEVAVILNVFGLHEDSNHRDGFVNALMGLSMKHDVNISGAVVEELACEVLRFSMEKGRNLRTSAENLFEVL